MVEGKIFGPLTEREDALVERAYMGAIVANQIMNSINSPVEIYSAANRATHVCAIDCECDARMEMFDRRRKLSA